MILANAHIAIRVMYRTTLTSPPNFLMPKRLLWDSRPFFELD